MFFFEWRRWLHLFKLSLRGKSPKNATLWQRPTAEMLEDRIVPTGVGTNYPG